MQTESPAPATTVAAASGSSSSSSSSSSSLRPPTLYLLSPEAGGQGARPRKKRTAKSKKPLSPEELAEAEPEEGKQATISRAVCLSCVCEVRAVCAVSVR